MNYSNVTTVNQPDIFKVLDKYVIVGCLFLLIGLNFYFGFYRVLHKNEWAYTASSCIIVLKLAGRVVMVQTVYHSPPNPSHVPESSSL